MYENNPNVLISSQNSRVLPPVRRECENMW